MSKTPYRMVVAAGKVDNVNVFDRQHVALLVLLHVHQHLARLRFEVERHLGRVDEVPPVRVVAELSVLGQPERVQVSLDVEYDGKLGTAADLNDRRPVVADPGGRGDRGQLVADAALAALVVAARVHRAGVGEEERMVPTARRLYDVEVGQVGHLRRLLARHRIAVAQLAQLIASCGKGVVQQKWPVSTGSRTERGNKMSYRT